MHIAEYDEMANRLDEIKEYSNFLPDVSSDEGYQKSKRVSLDIGKVKTSLEKARKDKKSFFIEGGKQVDSQAKKILKKLDDMQSPHMLAYKELDGLKKEREAQRKQGLEDRVAFIRNLPHMLSESCSDEIMAAMNDMNNENCETFYEFTSVALKARNETIKLLGELFTKISKAEKDAEDLAKLRAEQAEREQKEHEARIANQAKEEAERIAKIEQDRIEGEKQAAIQREQVAKQAVVDAEKRAKEQEEQAKHNAINAKKARIEVENQAKQAAKQAEAQRKQDAINAETRRLADIETAKQNEINRQQDELKAKQEAQAKLEANKKHVGKIRGEIKNHLMSACGLDNELATKVVKELLHLDQVTINY